MTSHNLHESLSLFLWIFKFLMWIFLQFNQLKRLLFLPSERGKKHIFKLFENILILCFQVCVFSLVAQEQLLNFGIVHWYPEWQSSSHLWIWTRSLNVLCLFFFFFFPPHYYLLEIGQLTLMTFQLAVVWEYQVLLHKSSSSLSKLVDLVSDYWYKLEEAQICLWHPSWANFSAIVKVCKRISSLFLKWIPSLYLTEFEIFQNLFSRAQYDIGQKNCCLEVAGFSPWL